MDYSERIIEDIETFNVRGISDCFSNGVTPNDLFKGLPLIYELISGYKRGPAFKECVRLFVEHGLDFPDQPLLAVLLDDASILKDQLESNPRLINSPYSLRCAFTPLLDVTLLHICAEFNHVNCANMLLTKGADVNARAGIDNYGFGGQTPIFHTVNQSQNASADMMDLLIEKSADLSFSVRGLRWGQSHDWETFIPCVNPISYAMMGLLPQMHRDENVIAKVVSKLMTRAYSIDYPITNIPNKYLRGTK